MYVRKEASEDGVTCRILCYSTGKARKEKAIADKNGDPFLDDIERFRRSIQNGTIKNTVKMENKLNRIILKHVRRAANFEVALEFTEGKVTGISATRKKVQENPLCGCYVIESTHTELSALEIWKLYMTLTRVESAFRSMKETLGMRPIYHQNAERSAAHLFVTVLAYHLLATIENTVSQHGDNRTWGSMRETLSTLMRGTVSIRDNHNVTYDLRISGEPESEHKVILDEMDIRSLPKSMVSVIDTL